MTTLWIEIHQKVFLQFFFDAGLRSTDDIFLRIVTCRIRTLIDRYHTTIDRTELAEEIASHLFVIEILTVLTTIVMFRHPEFKHPAGVCTEFIIARVKRVLQDKVTIAIAVWRHDDILPFHHQAIRREQFHIEDTAHVGIVKVIGTHHIRLIPNGIALVITIIVEVQIDFLLNRRILKHLSDAVETSLRNGSHRTKKSDESHPNGESSYDPPNQHYMSPTITSPPFSGMVTATGLEATFRFLVLPARLASSV